MQLEEYVTENSIREKKNVFYFSDPNMITKKEILYRSIRKIEGRTYTDNEVKLLPIIRKNHPLYIEWKIRANSIYKVLSYLKSSDNSTILDLGCGNGWASNFIANNLNCKLFGIDLYKIELEQGARVFNKTKNLIFIYGDLIGNIFPNQVFDKMLLGSSIQYFPSFIVIIEIMLKYLKPNGEIQVFDSPFYEDDDVITAKKRTQVYYKKLGVPEMSNYYFHHSYSSLKEFNSEILYRPQKRKIFHKILRSKRYESPFPWIKIKKN